MRGASRFRGRNTGARPRNGSRTYLLTGMIQCASGHEPKAMYGKVDKGTTYHVCAYARDYEPQLVGKRIAELREEKERLESALEETASDTPEASMNEIADILKRLPDLAEELRAAPTELKRQVFEAFQPRISYDKLERRITSEEHPRGAPVSVKIADGRRIIGACQRPA